MKKLNDYIVEQEINEALWWEKFKNLFKSGGRAMKTIIKNKFANAYPNWYKEYEKLEKITDVEEAKKTIDALLAAVDEMPDYKDDTARAAAKLATLYTKKGDAEEAKNKELVKLIDSKIKEMREANPEAQKQVEKEMKQIEKENGGKDSEGGEGDIKPGVNAAVQNKKEVESAKNILGLNGDDLARVIGKMERMFDIKESLAVFESNKTDQKYRKTIKNLYDNPKTKQETDIALTTLFLAYEKLKVCAKKGGCTINQQIMQALINGYEIAEEKTKEEVKNDINNAVAAQK